MNQSSTPMREKLFSDDKGSILISDSDDDLFVEKSQQEKVYIIESTESSEKNTPRSTPSSRMSPIRRSSSDESEINRRLHAYIPGSSEEEEDEHGGSSVIGSVRRRNGRRTIEDDSYGETLNDTSRTIATSKRKDISHDVTKENIKGLRFSTSRDSIEEFKSHSSEDEYSKNSHEWAPSNLGDNDSESELAISLAKKEIGVGNVDPLAAQKRALLVCKMEQLKDELKNSQLLLDTEYIDLLPDKGEKLHQNIARQEEEIAKIAAELENTPLIQNNRTEQYFMKHEVNPVKEENYDEYKLQDDRVDFDNMLMKLKNTPKGKVLGEKAQATHDKELALTVERLQDLHGSLVARPTEDQMAEDPRGLKVKLMPHQQHALAWLMWREQQKPPGGVLADDMGLGKTLTMISLIISNIAKSYNQGSDLDSDDEWTDGRKPLRHRGGTLVVCPASLLSQWEFEIENKCKRGTLSVEVYHGNNRESIPKRLAKNDVVITTYNILTREFKTTSTVYRIHWKRVILDEAHIIRNHKSQAAQAVCGLLASYRWALTGTPIQNVELDLYSILKFLKCSPFDDLRVWKRWVDNKNAAGSQRLATVMKTLMLRRTKQELQSKGALQSLPDKFIEEISVKLDSEEQLVYEKVLIYSRTLFGQFLAQKAEKDHMVDLGIGKFDKPSFISNPNKNTHFTKAQDKLLNLHADVKTHEILVLLLRLRQICVHPWLIEAFLDQEDVQESGLIDTNGVDNNLLSQINKIKLHDEDEDTEDQEIGVDNRVVTTSILTADNPVFEYERVSSKMRAVLDTVQEILRKGDKVIIVSQWTSMLEIVAFHLSKINIKDSAIGKFTGKVPIKDRQGIQNAFNAEGKDPKILLLSLTAGGVGLNLVGGNHLLLVDIHWNPQLETQAQDRIYRFGQKKNVYIYKFICKDTIEERIKNLQERKLEIARNVLSGDGSAISSKLTLNDLKSLFAL